MQPQNLIISIHFFRILIDISNIILNWIIVHALRKLKKTNIISQWFILCLSTSDIFIGIIGFLSHIYGLILCFLDSSGNQNYIKKFLLLLIILLEQFSAIQIFIIAIDRCLRMKYRSRYNILMTKNKARILVAINVVISLLFNMLRTYYAVKKSPKNYVTSIIVNHAFNLTFLVLTHSLYVSSYLSMKSEGRKCDPIKLETSVKNKVGCVSWNAIKVTDIETVSNRISRQNEFKIVGHYPPIQVDRTKNCLDNARLMPVGNYIETTVHHGNGSGRESDVKQEDANKEKATKSEQIARNMIKITNKREESLRKSIFCILLAMTLCYAPSVLTDLITRIKGHSNDSIQIYLGITITLNSSLNAIILIAFSKELRKFVRSLVLGCCR